MRAKPTSQQRSQDKRDRILDAMDALLRHKLFAEISVADLAAKAKVAPATIYQRFSNVDATASVLMELYFRQVEAWARRRRQPPRRSESLFDALLTIAGDAHDQVTALGYVMRPAYLYSRHRPDRSGAEWARLEQVALSGFTAFLQQWSAEIRVRDIDQAAAVICYLFNFMLLGPLLHGENTRRSPLGSRKRFAEALASLAHRYLTCGEHTAGGSRAGGDS
jgi:AcrR family transcriptional regulator